MMMMMMQRLKWSRLVNSKYLLNSPKSIGIDFFGDRNSSWAATTDGKKEKSFKLLVIGGGAGGCSVAAKFVSKLGKNNVGIVEPTDVHYYQPMFTLIGGGIKKLKDSFKPMRSVLPKDAEWVRDSVQKIEPQENYVMTKNGIRINYEFLVVAAGLKLEYAKIPGLVESLLIPGSGVCSNYSPEYVERTYQSLEYFDEGNLIFTFPNTPVKCAGAPQKICYLAEHYLRKTKKREKARVLYHTAQPKLFSVQKYADSLWKVCKARGIEVNLNSNLIEIEPDRKIAYFARLDNPELPKVAIPYSVLHVTPPMTPPPFLRLSPMLSDNTGYLDVNPKTLRHKFFNNIYGIGDCTNLPTSKTAAAAAAQGGVLYENLMLSMADPDQAPTSFYNGYTSCPLVTGYNKCILAEFDYNLQPLETFPMDQSKERMSMFYMKKDLMPLLYWQMMLKGYWNGPELMRKILHLNFKDKKAVDVPASS